MRTAAILTGALACVVTFTGCTPESSAPPETPPVTETPEPEVELTTPGITEPPPPAGAEIAESESAEPVGPPTEESTTTLAPVEQPTPQGGPWTDLDLTLRSAADVAQATDLPDSLQAFLANRIGVEDEVGCVTDEVQLHGIHVDGFAYGREESPCGGGYAIWGIADNAWNYIVQFGDPMPCDMIAQNDVPPGTPDLTCLDKDGQGQDY